MSKSVRELQIHMEHTFCVSCSVSGLTCPFMAFSRPILSRVSGILASHHEIAVALRSLLDGLVATSVARVHETFRGLLRCIMRVDISAPTCVGYTKINPPHQVVISRHQPIRTLSKSRCRRLNSRNLRRSFVRKEGFHHVHQIGGLEGFLHDAVRAGCHGCVDVLFAHVRRHDYDWEVRACGCAFFTQQALACLFAFADA
jgi:hypothetical protein